MGIIHPTLYKFSFKHWPGYQYGYVAARSLAEALEYLGRPRNEGDGKSISPAIRYIEEIGHVEIAKMSNTERQLEAVSA